MKLELDCTWNERKNRAKQTIHFDYQPKIIFNLPREKIVSLQGLSQSVPQRGPLILEELKDLNERYRKSLYALLNWYQALQFFQYFEEAQEVFIKMKTLFPEQVFMKCIIGESLLREKKYKEFPSLFNHIEVLRGAFSKRRDFFFEEALFFHNLWGRYFFEMGNEFQAEKHKKLIFFIMNTLHNFQMATCNG